MAERLTGLAGDAFPPRVATRVFIAHPHTGERLDDAVATRFVRPHSYTGEDALEISTHGGFRVPQAVLAACIAAGCRLAMPGEFTRRAVLNGRMDLVQAEAVGDLIDARTSAMARQALAQLDGGLSRRLDALRSDVIGLEALIAYDIDFPEEDDGPIASARVTESASTLLASIDALLATAPQGAMLRDGALVVIAGPPNAGKSSLFNAMLGDARALVTPIAGTTRDAIEATLDRMPLPLRLVDTAGLRETSDEIERLGIEISARYAGQAQVLLACGERDEDVERTVAIARDMTDGVVLAVRTKSDLARDGDREHDRDRIHARDREHDRGLNRGHDTTERLPHFAVSAETGEGIVALLRGIDEALSHPGRDAGRDGAEPMVVTRERHRVALLGARLEIGAFLEAWTTGAVPATVAATHLHAARDALGDVTGVIALDEVLDRLFSEFCIGK